MVTKENIPEKGAAVQKDMESFAIIPYLPGGLVEPETLHRIADVAEKYGVKIIKLNSEHRIGFYGVKEEDIDAIWADLDMEPGGFTGKCVRASKFCIGSSSCKKAFQNTIDIGLKIDEKFHRMKTPNKVKIAISGCTNSCGESNVRDIGLIGTPKGWKLLVGGTCGLQARPGKLFAENLSETQAMIYIEKILDYYVKKDLPNRMGVFIDKVGFEKFKGDILNGL